jgi:hypothetical protein
MTGLYKMHWRAPCLRSHALCYGLITGTGKKFFSSSVSRSALEFSQLPIQWLLSDFFRKVNCPEREAVITVNVPDNDCDIIKLCQEKKKQSHYRP